MSRNKWAPIKQGINPRTGLMETRVCFNPESEWLDGHFPGKPVVPGAALLTAVHETAASLMKGADEGLQEFHFNKVKFKQMVLPEQELSISLTRVGDVVGKFNFDILRDGESVCSGVISFKISQ